MTLGHFTMAFEDKTIFFLSLGLLIIGNGFFKPNISTMVGGLYKQGDAKRDAGFTIFYMGINIGAFIAPLVCGWLGVSYGWHYGFGAAGIGMLTPSLQPSCIHLTRRRCDATACPATALANDNSCPATCSTTKC